MYYALVQTHLIYGIIAWGGVMDCHMKMLGITQKWIPKIIYSKPYLTPSDDLYLEAGILDARQLYCQTLILHNDNNFFDFLPKFVSVNISICIAFMH